MENGKKGKKLNKEKKSKKSGIKERGRGEK